MSPLGDHVRRWQPSERPDATGPEPQSLTPTRYVEPVEDEDEEPTGRDPIDVEIERSGNPFPSDADRAEVLQAVQLRQNRSRPVGEHRSLTPLGRTTRRWRAGQAPLKEEEPVETSLEDVLEELSEIVAERTPVVPGSREALLAEMRTKP